MVSKSALFALLVATVSPAPAFADTAPGTPQERAACRPDVRKFCQSVIKPGAGNAAVLTCLVERRDSLSTPCLTVLKNHNIL